MAKQKLKAWLACFLCWGNTIDSGFEGNRNYGQFLIISGPAWIPCDMQFYHQQSTDLWPFFDPLWQGFEMIVNMPRPEMTGILLHMFHQTFSRHALKPKLRVRVSFSLSPFHVAFIPDPWKWINSAPRTAMDNAVWEIVKGKRKLKKFCARQENLRPRKIVQPLFFSFGMEAYGLVVL